MDYGEATPASGRQAPVGFRPGADVDPPSVALAATCPDRPTCWPAG